MTHHDDVKEIKEYYSFIQDEELRNIFIEASIVATCAAYKWLQENSTPKYTVHNANILGQITDDCPIDYMLDLCGNAYLTLKDLRSVMSKRIKKEKDLLICSGCSLALYYVNIQRQEYGLHCASVKAFKEVLDKNNIVTSFHSYID